MQEHDLQSDTVLCHLHGGAYALNMRVSLRGCVTRRRPIIERSRKSQTGKELNRLLSRLRILRRDNRIIAIYCFLDLKYCSTQRYRVKYLGVKYLEAKILFYSHKNKFRWPVLSDKCFLVPNPVACLLRNGRRLSPSYTDKKFAYLTFILCWRDGRWTSMNTKTV